MMINFHYTFLKFTFLGAPSIIATNVIGVCEVRRRRIWAKFRFSSPNSWRKLNDL
jgi:hypothetical protein